MTATYGKIISLGNFKGGVGKTTVAVHLACWMLEANCRVAFVDADAQSSSSKWLVNAAPSMPRIRLEDPNAVYATLNKLTREYEYIVVDGPGALAVMTKMILLVSDTVLMPCGPSSLDLWSAEETVKLLREAEGLRAMNLRQAGGVAGSLIRAFIVPNKVQMNFRLSQDLLDVVAQLGVPVSSPIKLRQAYADAVTQGKVAWRLKTRASQEAGLELTTLFGELFPAVQEKWEAAMLERAPEDRAGEGTAKLAAQATD